MSIIESSQAIIYQLSNCDSQQYINIIVFVFYCYSSCLRAISFLCKTIVHKPVSVPLSKRISIKMLLRHNNTTERTRRTTLTRTTHSNDSNKTRQKLFLIARMRISVHNTLLLQKEADSKVQ